MTFLDWRKSIIQKSYKVAEPGLFCYFNKEKSDAFFEAFVKEVCANLVSDELKEKASIDRNTEVSIFRNYKECGLSFQVKSDKNYIRKYDDTSLTVPRFNVDVKEIQCEKVEEFESIFQDSLSKNYYIELADDNTRLSYGFLVVNGSGVSLYSIKFHAFSGETKIKVKKVGKNKVVVQELCDNYE